MEALRVALDEPLNICKSRESSMLILRPRLISDPDALSWGSQAISQYVENFPDNLRAVICKSYTKKFRLLALRI